MPKELINIPHLVYTFNGAGDYIYSQTDFVTTHVRSVKIDNSVTSVLAAIGLKDEKSRNVVEIWAWTRISKYCVWNVQKVNVDRILRGKIPCFWRDNIFFLNF